MKKITFFLFAIAMLALISCEKKSQLLDPNAVLSIRPAAGVRSTNPEHLSALEIVKQCNDMFLIYNVTGKPANRGWADAQKDLNPDAPRLKMWGTDIIATSGKLEDVFLLAKDVVFVINYGLIDGSDRKDTIAYIPNKTIQDAWKIIKPAFDAQEYDKVYKVFDEAYRFIPITGAEYAELRKQGLN